MAGFYRCFIPNFSSIASPLTDLTERDRPNSITDWQYQHEKAETELKWIKLLQRPFPLGFNDNIYHEGTISKMPDFDVFSLLEIIRKRKSRSHGIRKKGNGKRKKRAVKRSNTSLKDLSKVLEDHG